MGGPGLLPPWPPSRGWGWFWPCAGSWGPHLISGIPEEQRELGWDHTGPALSPPTPRESSVRPASQASRDTTRRLSSADGPWGLVRATLPRNCPRVAIYPARQGSVGRRQEILSRYFPVSGSWGHVTSPDRKSWRPHWPPAFLSPSLPAASCLPSCPTPFLPPETHREPLTEAAQGQLRTTHTHTGCHLGSGGRGLWPWWRSGPWDTWQGDLCYK